MSSAFSYWGLSKDQASLVARKKLERSLKKKKIPGIRVPLEESVWEKKKNPQTRPNALGNYLLINFGSCYYFRLRDIAFQRK